MSKHALALVVAGCVFSATLSAADNYRGRTIGSACFGCHGSGGASGASIPPIIVGTPAGFIETSLKAFRDGSRPSTIMQRIARGYSDEDIAAVARYLSELGGE